jgi:CDP-diacylglycerol--serine O-phosphatidyltransferase
MSTINKYTLLANLFTISNAIVGVIGIIVSIYYHIDLPFVAMQMLVFGELFDFLDGYMAKKGSTTSNFGVYADTVSDVITFAVLPGIMLLNTSLLGTSNNELMISIPLIIAGFYSLCGWIRLVRFSSSPTTIYFEGLPSPAAALLIGASATLSYLSELPLLFGEDGIVLSLLAIITGILMVSKIRYPTPKRKQKSDLGLIAVAGCVVISFLFFPEILTLGLILFISLLYTIFGPFYFFRTE